ncbi:MAG: hypothetical protein JOZ24_00480 [Candidatus Eremiobacteraeota bacterium]|nr:hypothetical protein [Candidatus Eremiobacteraeota bacterium]
MTLADVPSYRDVVAVEECWHGFAEDGVPVRFFHRPLERLVADLVAAGFVIRALQEPGPTPEIEARDPDAATKLRRQPCFLLIDASTAATR